MGWIIEHETERDEEGLPLVWSNSEGFTSGDDFETFSDEEKENLSLPMNGKWQHVTWNKGE